MKKNINIIEKNFFFLDSNSLDTVQTHLYGYCIADDVDGKELSIEDVEFPRAYSGGAYVLIQNIGDKLYISQDYSGSCGIYLFRQGDYFALSNSFLLMLENLNACFHLSFNYDYANAYMATSLNPLSYSETLINEIELLPRDIRIVIDRKCKSIEIINIDYHEHSVDIATTEGLRMLDEWYAKWTYIIREVKATTNSIMCDLSGGFDSRLTFGLFMHSGINPDEVHFRSHQGKLHTWEEDYQIASDIAEHFSVSLNQGRLSSESTELGFEESVNNSVYTKFGLHKEMYWSLEYRSEPLFWFNGCGGECLRRRSQAYIQDEYKSGQEYKNVEVSKVIKRIIDNTHERTMAKLTSGDEKGNELARCVYRETVSRYHFGRQAMERYCGNVVMVNPLMDVKLSRIYSHESEDADLLMAVIFTRYYPELLSFPYAKGGKIEKETIERARQVNQILPFQTVKRTMNPEKRLFCFGDNKVSGSSKSKANIFEINKFIYDVFRTDRVHKMMMACFHEDIYKFADRWKETQGYHPLKHIYSIISVYLVWDILINRGKKPHQSVIERMKDTIAAGLVNPTLCLKETNHSKKNYTFLFPFEMIPQNADIILYGAGKVGQTFYKQIEKSGYCKISAWVDRDHMKFGGGCSLLI